MPRGRKPNPTSPCCLSEKGWRELHPQQRWATQHGVVCGESCDRTCWYVKWNGQPTRHRYHKSFITELDAPWRPLYQGFATLEELLWRSTSVITEDIENVRVRKGSIVKGMLNATYLLMRFRQGEGTLIALYRNWMLPPHNIACWPHVAQAHKHYL